MSRGDTWLREKCAIRAAMKTEQVKGLKGSVEAPAGTGMMPEPAGGDPLDSDAHPRCGDSRTRTIRPLPARERQGFAVGRAFFSVFREKSDERRSSHNLQCNFLEVRNMREFEEI
jgi:hypothetical protein